MKYVIVPNNIYIKICNIKELVMLIFEMVPLNHMYA